MGDLLEFKSQIYHFINNEVRNWHSKTKLIKIKIKNNRLYLETPEKERIVKAKLIGDFMKVEFLKDPPDFILYLIATIFFFFKMLVSKMVDSLEG
ncbi:MAG: hypothetical protein ACTSR3_08125 [Candidatus Helarchaeota archaeon]